MTPLYIRTVRLKTVSEDILSKDHDNISLITGFQCKGKHTVIDALPYQSDIRSDRTFFQITLPLMKPSLAAVGFMMATAYWNDWQNALLYITSDNKKPLQLLLVNIQKSIEFLLNNSNVPASARAAMGGNIPQYSATMATVVVVIAPIMVVYPFFQKYFVKGLTVGSVKG